MGEIKSPYNLVWLLGRTPVLAELKRVGIGPGCSPPRSLSAWAPSSVWRRPRTGGHAYLSSLAAQHSQTSEKATGGWFVAPADTGDFGTDYDLRAVVALDGVAANRPAEAVYAVGLTDSALADLDGANDYVIQFPAHGLPPARCFWSLTMYDEIFALVQNPINRYEIGSETTGLERNKNGSLDRYPAIAQTG